MLTKSAVYSLWNMLAEVDPSELTSNVGCPSIIPFIEKDFGKVLCYSRYLALLSRVAFIAFEDTVGPRSRKFSNAERLALLLERMELS